MGARFCRSADTPGTALGSYTARDDGCDNDSSSSLRLLQPHPLHSGSILGIASVPHSPTLTSPLPGRRAIFTCSDDKCIAVVDETIEPGKESEAARSWEPARAVLLPCHDKAVNRLAAGSNSLFSCSRDLAVKHWRISNGEDGGPTSLSLVQSFDKAHDLTIADIATNSDGSVLCSGSRDYSVRVWDVASGKCAHEYRAPRNVVTSLLLAGGDALSQHPSPGLLYQASEDLCVRVWDYRAPARQPAVHITGFVYFPLCLALRPDGLALATGCKGFDSNGCEVKLWDLRAPERCLTEYKGHSMDVTAVRYCPSSGRLFSVSKDGSLFAWNGAYCSSSSGGGGVSPHVACRRGSGKHFTSLVVHGGPAGAALLAGAFDGSLSRYSFSEDSGSLLLQAATPPFFAAEEEEVV